MSDKPVIFISHASTDVKIVDVLKGQIDRVFANGVDVFATSLPYAVSSGADWLQEIRTNLDKAQVVVVLITPISINRPWIWFEVGASWSKMSEGKGKICPLCVPEIQLADLPEPLNRLHARSLGNTEHVKIFFQELCVQFGFGNMKGFKASTVTAKLPKYSDLNIDQNDLQPSGIYYSPYEGYSESDLKSILEEYIGNQWSQYTLAEKNYFRSINRPFDGLWISKSQATLFGGKIQHYYEIDKNLNLPLGSTKQLLKELAKEFGLKIVKETEKFIQFNYDYDSDPRDHSSDGFIPY